MTSYWKPANLSAVIPSDLGVIIDTTQTVVGTVAIVLDTLSSAISAIKAFLIAFPVFDWASLLIRLVEEFRTNFLATGFYMCNMWDYPMRMYYMPSDDTFETSFEADLIASMTDSADPNRPQFTGEVAMLVMILGAPGLPDMSLLLKMAKDAFSWWKELQFAYESVTRTYGEESIVALEIAVKNGEILISDNPSEQTQQVLTIERSLQQCRDFIESGDFINTIIPAIPSLPTTPEYLKQFLNVVSENSKMSAYPSWQAASLRIILPPLVDVVDQALEPVIDMLRAGKNVVDTVTDLIDALDSKVQQLQRLLESIDTYIQLLDNLIAATGFYAIFVTAPDGIDGLTRELRAATNKPFADLEHGVFSGFSLVAGGPGVTAFKNLFGPIGGASV